MDDFANLFNPESLNHLLEHFKKITPEEFDERFHTIVSDTDEDCSVCATKLEEYVKTPCGHRFHRDCLKRWLFQSNNCKATCPNCRQEIKTNREQSEDEQFIREKGAEIMEAMDVAGTAFGEILERIHSFI